MSLILLNSTKAWTITFVAKLNITTQNSIQTTNSSQGSKVVVRTEGLHILLTVPTCWDESCKDLKLSSTFF
jgi:hypothetical protein